MRHVIGSSQWEVLFLVDCVCNLARKRLVITSAKASILNQQQMLDMINPDPDVCQVNHIADCRENRPVTYEKC